MNAVAFKASRKNGDYIKTTVVPANYLAEPHFGLIDGTIAAFFLLCIAGLICLLLN
jgi:hypothetical protein